MKIQFKQLRENAQVPVIKTSGSAGFDIYANSVGTIKSGSKYVVNPGFACAIPQGYVGFVKPRSGFAMINSIDVLGGVIDSDYRGEVKVILINHGENDFLFNYGDRIAQLCVLKNLTDYEIVDDIDDTVRGSGGFGSTGK